MKVNSHSQSIQLPKPLWKHLQLGSSLDWQLQSIIMHLPLMCTNKTPNKMIEVHNPFINNVSLYNPGGESHHNTSHKYPSLSFSNMSIWLSLGRIWKFQVTTSLRYLLSANQKIQIQQTEFFLIGICFLKAIFPGAGQGEGSKQKGQENQLQS